MTWTSRRRSRITRSTQSAEGLAARLAGRLTGSATEADWEAFRSAGSPLRAEVVRVLKHQLDADVRSHPPTALALSEVLDRATEHVPELAVLARRGRATALHFNGRDEEAIVEFNRCVDLYETSGEDVEAARVRRSLVEVLQQAGRGEEALRCADAARAVLERHNDPVLLAQLEVNVGNVYLHRDEYDRARDHYTHAHELFASCNERVGQAFSGFNLAVVEMNANRLEAAEAAWRGSRAAWSEAGMAVHVADCDYSLAYLESRRGRFEAAIQGLERARAGYEETAKPAGVPLCDLDLAEIYLKLDALYDAADHARRAAASFEELQHPYEQARAEAFLGLAYARMGRQRDAGAAFDRAGERLIGLGNDVYADALVVQRAFLVPAQENEPAVLARSRDRLFARGMVVPATMAWIALARAHLAKGAAEVARDEMSRLLEGRSASDPGCTSDPGTLEEVLEAEARRTLAAARTHLGDRLGAIEDLRTATRAIDRVYGSVAGADLRLTFLRDRHDAFADLSWLLAEGETPGAAREAFLVLERSRSRSLEGPDEVEVVDDEYRLARERLDWLLSRRLDFEFGQVAGEHDLRALEAPPQEVRAVQDQVATLARRRRRDRPLVPASDPEVFDEATLRAACGKDDVLLAYLTTEAGARVWIVDGGEVESQAISISVQRLENLRDRLWLHLDRCRWDAGDRSHLERSIDPILTELGTRLVEPVLSRIDGRRIVVLPFGILHDVPFHALRVGVGPFSGPLVERCDIGYAFSAGMLARRRSAPAQVDGRILATGAGRASLVQVDEELGHLRRLFGSRVDEVGPESIVTRLAESPPRGGLLHIAGHGLHQPDNAVFSALSLGDRVLLAHDISKSRLDLALAVLSGCETGRKSRLGGDELFGLSRAFFSAGTRSVVGSLWSVEDRDAALFMGRFYEHLAAGETVRTAVCRAQRELREQRGHPYSWGAFVVTGDPDLRFPA